MGRSLHLGTFFSIPVKVHWTFGLIVFMTVYLVVQFHLSFDETFWFVLCIFSLFTCVILHEFGHALSAKRYGVSTRDIFISPIGGLARLESIPKNPLQELVIAIAGPMVNLVIASGLFLISMFVLQLPADYLFDEFQMPSNGPEYLRTLFSMNVVLFLFNLIPAFPMDGGRILRALLSIKLGNYRSTVYATLIGKGFAILFLIFGLWNAQYAMTFIAIFVFYMAHMEYKQVSVEHMMTNKTIGEIGNMAFTKMSFTDPMSRVYDLVESGKESSFLVFDYDDNVVASLPNLFIRDAQHNPANTSRPVAEFTSAKVSLLPSTSSIEVVKNTMEEKGLSIVGLLDDGKLTSVVDRARIIAFMQDGKI